MREGGGDGPVVGAGSHPSRSAGSAVAWRKSGGSAAFAMTTAILNATGRPRSSRVVVGIMVGYRHNSDLIWKGKMERYSFLLFFSGFAASGCSFVENLCSVNRHIMGYLLATRRGRSSTNRWGLLARSVTCVSAVWRRPELVSEVRGLVK